MLGDDTLQDRSEQAILEQAQTQLAAVFDKMPYEVPLLLFTSPIKNEVFIQAARQVIRALRELTPKITLLEYDLSHKIAQKWKVKHAPTLLFDPERYNVRWLGAPMGEEGRTFVEALIMMGYKKTNLSEESLKVLGKIQSPRNIKVFVSPTCPYCPQQAVNALKVAIEKPELVSLEIIDIQVNPEIADQYSAQSVPQAFANEKLIAQGAQTEELFMLSLEKIEQQTVFIPESDAELVEIDLVIVGGGPAGLTAGIYAVRSGLKTAVVELGALGGQVATTPVVENYPGFTSVGGKTLVDIMVNHALEYVQIFQGEEVVEIEPGDPIKVLTSRRRFLAKAVLLATGASHRHLGAAGENRLAGRGVSYCSTCDGPLFKGKKVVMVGGGDSAVTEALHLYHMGVDVTVIHRRDPLRAQEHLTKNLFDNNIPVLRNTEVKEIHGEEKVKEIVLYNNKTEETTTFETDGVFIAIGYTPSVELAKKIGVELTPDGFIKRDSRHRTNIPGIYSAGDVEGGYKQIVTATGQGSEAALAIFEDLMNPYWKQVPSIKG
ncbi:MAG: FAD-dependent oxidoreductase, partial [Desulfobacteraceae bacterium]|nr:FAD-dependent oxidoreductase [Desulfobacteraceae bacterium]